MISEIRLFLLLKPVFLFLIYRHHPHKLLCIIITYRIRLLTKQKKPDISVIYFVFFPTDYGYEVNYENQKA